MGGVSYYRRTTSDPSRTCFVRLHGSRRVAIKGLGSFTEGKPLTLEVTPANGSASFDITVNHTFNGEQIEWFKAGSALNLMKQANA